MNVAYLALYIVAAVCFLIRWAWGPNSHVDLLAAGLLAWVLVPLIHTAHR